MDLPFYFKHGNDENVDNLSLHIAEGGFTEDTGRFFIGDKDGNKVEYSKKTELDNISSQLSDIVSEQTTQNTNINLKADKVELEAEISNRTNAVSNEKTERQTEIAVERARINVFTALAAGSTTGDAELIDARVGANGKTYSTAGESVRNQIDALQNKLDIAYIWNNIFDVNNTTNVQEGVYFDEQGNTQTASNLRTITLDVSFLDGNLLVSHAYRRIIGYNKDNVVSLLWDGTGATSNNVSINVFDIVTIKIITEITLSLTNFIVTPKSVCDETTKMYGISLPKNNHLEHKGLENLDFDKCFTTGFYYLSTLYSYTNSPISSGLFICMSNSYPTGTRTYQLAISYDTGETYTRQLQSGVFSEWKLLNSDIYYTKTEVSNLISSGMTFSKTADEIIIKQGKSTYVIYHNTNTNINLETWMIKSGSINNNIVWQLSDIEGPIKQVGASDFCGGVHGDEQYTQVRFLLDGVEIGETDVITEKEFTSFVMFTKSNIYFCNDTTNIAFNRYKKLEFKGNKLIVSNQLIYVGSNAYYVERWPACGIYSIYKDMMVGYDTNYDCKLLDSVGTSTNKLIDTVSFHGTDYDVTVKALSPKYDQYLGWVQYFSEETRPRFKAYLDTINNSAGDCVLSNHDVLIASYEIEII